MTATTFTLTNDFHGTSARVRLPEGGGPLSEAQIRRVERTLCGMDDCTCSGDLGVRGEQSCVVEIAPDFGRGPRAVTVGPKIGLADDDVSPV